MLRTSVVTAAVVLAPQPLRAQPDEEAAVTALPPAPETPVRAPTIPELTDVVLVGPVARAATLERLVQQLLAADGVTARFSEAASVQETDLLAPPATAGAPRPCIWITQPAPNWVRLFLADAARERYLVRDVPLRSGLDVLGSELTAQVVQSSATALLQKHEGMNRAGLRTRFREGSRAQQQRPAPTARAGVDGGRESAKELAVRADAGYVGLWTGRQFGLMHGPALRLGAEWTTPRVVWSAFLSGERTFYQRHVSRDLELGIQATAVRALLGGRFPMAESLDLMSLAGAGLDAVRVAPRARAGSDTEVASPATLVQGWVRVETGPEWHTGEFGVRLAAVADTSLAKTSYVVREGDRQQDPVRPFVVRPGLLFDVSWRPGTEKRAAE
jgi:hypothetical protein